MSGGIRCAALLAIVGVLGGYRSGSDMSSSWSRHPVATGRATDGSQPSPSIILDGRPPRHSGPRVTSRLALSKSTPDWLMSAPIVAQVTVAPGVSRRAGRRTSASGGSACNRGPRLRGNVLGGVERSGCHSSDALRGSWRRRRGRDQPGSGRRHARGRNLAHYRPQVWFNLSLALSRVQLRIRVLSPSNDSAV